MQNKGDYSGGTLEEKDVPAIPQVMGMDSVHKQMQVDQKRKKNPKPKTKVNTSFVLPSSHAPFVLAEAKDW